MEMASYYDLLMLHEMPFYESFLQMMFAIYVTQDRHTLCEYLMFVIHR